MLESQPVHRPLWKRIFLSPDEPRLRAGWRLLIQTVMMLIMLILLYILLGLLGLIIPELSASLLLPMVVDLVIITASVFLARWLLDHRSIVSLGLSLNRRALLDVIVGILMMFVVFVFIYAAMALAGWIDFNGFAWQDTPAVTVAQEMLLMFAVFVLAGWNEELLSRGYHLQTLASGLNLTWGVIISSSIFGLLHLGNPNATWASTLGIFFAGVFLAYGYIRTKRLWLPIGLHIGWNFFEGPVFGFPVSGMDTFHMTKILVSGPELWTGGAFGPEAGLIVLPALALGAVLIYFYSRILPPQQA